VKQDIQITVGANIYYGREGTEYGGIRIPFTPFVARGNDSVFLWVTYYF
jgi:hypothetical protein